MAHGPDLLVISYGLNDIRGGTGAGLFATETEAIIKAVRQECSPVIVLPGPYFMTGFTCGGDRWSHGSQELFLAFNDLIAGLAAAQDCLFVDLLGGYEEAEWMVHSDGVHANDVGHLVVAMRIFEVLAKNCSGLAAHTQSREKDIPPWRDESTLRSEYGY